VSCGGDSPAEIGRGIGSSMDPPPHRHGVSKMTTSRGVPRSTAMKTVGHKTESTYRRYAIVDEAMLKEGAAKLQTLHEAQAPAAPVVPLTKATRTTRVSSSTVRVSRAQRAGRRLALANCKNLLEPSARVHPEHPPAVPRAAQAGRRALLEATSVEAVIPHPSESASLLGSGQRSRESRRA
jgi:hypothetical protein